jgi:hypothetical protein
VNQQGAAVGGFAELSVENAATMERRDRFIELNKLFI